MCSVSDRGPYFLHPGPAGGEAVLEAREEGSAAAATRAGLCGQVPAHCKAQPLGPGELENIYHTIPVRICSVTTFTCSSVLQLTDYIHLWFSDTALLSLAEAEGIVLALPVRQ